MRRWRGADGDAPGRSPAGAAALLRYAGAWTLAGIGLVAVTVLLLRGGSPPDEVSLPPVRQTELADAARLAGCELRRSARREVLRPPVTGPPAPAARPAVYRTTPPLASLVGAMRRGFIVVQYRPPLAGDRVDALQKLQEAVPNGTIVTPNSDMPYTVAVTGWRRLLGCRQFQDTTVDAIRLFSGRFLGMGPDR